MFLEEDREIENEKGEKYREGKEEQEKKEEVQTSNFKCTKSGISRLQFYPLNSWA